MGAVGLHCTLLSPGDVDLGHFQPLGVDPVLLQWASLHVLAWLPEGEFLEAAFGGGGVGGGPLPSECLSCVIQFSHHFG